MRRFLSYIYTQRRALLGWVLTVVVCGTVLALYDLPLEPAGYAAVLSGVVLAAVLAAGWPAWARHCRAAEALTGMLPGRQPDLPEPEGGPAGQEAAYQAAIVSLTGRLSDRTAEARAERDDLLDYFTMWAHQAKTPLAAMRLLLQSEGELSKAELEQELFQTERYVGMAMDYLRLGSETSDLVLAPVPLDPVIRQSLRRFARMFILKKLTLQYAGTRLAPVTDSRWVGFLLEQLLSNAVKYTPAGGTVTVEVKNYELFSAIWVSDTGPGISEGEQAKIFGHRRRHPPRGPAADLCQGLHRLHRPCGTHLQRAGAVSLRPGGQKAGLHPHRTQRARPGHRDAADLPPAGQLRVKPVTDRSRWTGAAGAGWEQARWNPARRRGSGRSPA